MISRRSSAAGPSSHDQPRSLGGWLKQTYAWPKWTCARPWQSRRAQEDMRMAQAEPTSAGGHAHDPGMSTAAENLTLWAIENLTPSGGGEPPRVRRRAAYLSGTGSGSVAFRRQ